MEEVAEPVTGANDVKIKIHKTAICGTDLHIYNWDEWSQKTIETPRVIGHEYVGEIVEVGANVRNWKIGQMVSGDVVQLRKLLLRQGYPVAHLMEHCSQGFHLRHLRNLFRQFL